MKISWTSRCSRNSYTWSAPDWTRYTDGSRRPSSSDQDGSLLLQCLRQPETSSSKSTQENLKDFRKDRQLSYGLWILSCTTLRWSSTALLISKDLSSENPLPFRMPQYRGKKHFQDGPPAWCRIFKTLYIQEETRTHLTASQLRLQERLAWLNTNSSPLMWFRKEEGKASSTQRIKWRDTTRR